MKLILPGLWFFIFGACMGSFFNVLVDRLPEGRDIIRQRSACGACGTKLKWKDLIPVWSYLRLKGKCRYCGAKLSPWYLVSEIAVGLLYLTAFLRYSRTGSLCQLLADLILWSLLYIIAVIDWKTLMIMDIFSILVAVSGVVFSLLNGRRIVDILLGLAVGAGFLGILALLAKLILKRDGMGLGDIILLGALGCWFPWKRIIILAFLSAYVALIFVVVSMKKRKPGMKSEFPFGPALCTAAFLLCVAGEAIIGFLSRLTGLSL